MAVSQSDIRDKRGGPAPLVIVKLSSKTKNYILWILGIIQIAMLVNNGFFHLNVIFDLPLMSNIKRKHSLLFRFD